MILPLAHHSAVEALPVLAPVLVVGLFLLTHALRERRRPRTRSAPERGGGRG